MELKVESSRGHDGRPLACAPIAGLSDFTRYLSTKPATHNTRQLEKSFQNANYSYSGTITINYKNVCNEFRSLVCPCFRSQYYSLTLRRTGRASSGICSDPPGKLFTEGRSRAENQSDYDASRRPRAEGFVFGFKDYNAVLEEIIFPPTFQGDTSDHEQSGLIVVSGSTGAGKSNIVQGLVYSYLARLVQTQHHRQNRPPHLVTFEDPIERWFYPDPYRAQLNGFDYTPRQKGIDVACLSDALSDCLRQTPAAVYVGETRDINEWSTLIDFAGKGHLVFTTCHAGSLTEVLSSMRDAVKADTAAKRSSLAARVLAIIHVRSVDLAGSSAILPALWRRTAAGVKAITSDGLSAVLPKSASQLPPAPGSSSGHYCFGRRYFADRLIGELRNDIKDPIRDDDRLYTELRLRAAQLDLEGL